MRALKFSLSTCVAVLALCATGCGDSGSGPTATPDPTPVPTPTPMVSDTPEPCEGPRCEGSDLVDCDGNRQPCAHGCADAACLPECTGDATRCVEGQLERCRADGSGFDVAEACGFGCADDSACRLCDPGQTRCSEGLLERCTDDGLSFVGANRCNLGCAADGQSCLLCEADSAVCEDDVVVRCNAAGTELSRDDACEFGCALGVCCEREGCGPAICVAGETRCSGDAVEQCNDTGGAWEPQSNCDFGCQAGQCLGAACNTNEQRCVGPIAERCSEDRRSWRIERTCPHTCEAGTTRCVAPELRWCIDDGESCDPGETYDFGSVMLSRERELTLEITNAGDTTLRVTGLELAINPAFTPVEVPPLPLDLAPEATQQVRYLFRPSFLGPHETTLTLSCDDPDRPMVRLTLRANASERREMLIGEADNELDGYNARDDGADVTYYPGLQGLGHLYLAFQVYGAANGGRLEYTIDHDTERWDAGLDEAANGTPFGNDGGLLFHMPRSVIAVLPDDVIDQPIRIRATYTDPVGVTVEDGLDAVLRLVQP